MPIPRAYREALCSCGSPASCECGPAAKRAAWPMISVQLPAGWGCRTLTGYTSQHLASCLLPWTQPDVRSADGRCGRRLDLHRSRACRCRRRCSWSICGRIPRQTLGIGLLGMEMSRCRISEGWRGLSTCSHASCRDPSRLAWVCQPPGIWTAWSFNGVLAWTPSMCCRTRGAQAGRKRCGRWHCIRTP